MQLHPMRILIISFSILTLLIIFIVLTFLNSSKQNSSLKTIRIGYAVEAPYAFTTENGEVTGESPEIAKVIAKQLGYNNIEWIQTEFSSLIPGLLTNQFDVIAAGVFITPERAKFINFSEPTFHVQQALLVPTGNPDRIHSYKQIVKKSTLRIAVIPKSVEEEYLRNSKLESSRIILVPDALSGKAAIENGIANCLALSSPTIRWISQHSKQGKTEMAKPFEQNELPARYLNGYGAFAFRKTDKQLLSKWNKELKAYIGSKNHLELISKFGFSASELPDNISTKEIISQ